MKKALVRILLVSLVIGACSPGTETGSNLFPSVEPAPSEGAFELSPEPTHSSADELDFSKAREELVRNGILGYGITEAGVLEVMGKVPRHEFVPQDLRDLAYQNQALPIGYGQTISQPYIVALMTQELDVSSGDTVLEIGTGSGYQAAILAQLGINVYTIEIIGALAEQANERFDRLGYSGVNTLHADGYYGWKEFSPFDAIIVTAAPDHVPPPLLEQLKIGGTMVIPVGPVGGYQELWKILRIDEETFGRQSLGGVRFVPFTRLGEDPSDQIK
jgi:protein-L-isoaspartate(D-aspartate) O-methyltransferase